MNILIVGGTRFVGPLVINKLLKKKHKITVFNRGIQKSIYDKKITFIKGDRNYTVKIPGDFDIIIDTCAYNAKQLKNVIEHVNFKYYINFGTAASYKKTNTYPLTETSTLGEWSVWGDYNKGKSECENVLKKSGFNYSSIRPVYILGSGNYINREEFIYTKIIREETIFLPGNGQAICQFIFAEEVADIIVFLAEQKINGAFNCAGDELITLEGLVEIMAKIVGKTAKIEFNSSADGENFNIKEFPFANVNFICSNNKLKKLGFEFLTLMDTLKAQYKNYYKRLLT